MADKKTSAEKSPEINVLLQRAIHAITAALKFAEPELTELDRQVGDGDLGQSLAQAAAAIEEELARDPASDAASTLTRLAHIVRRTVGGTSGPLYAVGLVKAAQALKAHAMPLPSDWACALQLACDGISELGGAVEGDRTMLDALCPAAKSLHAILEKGASARLALESGMRAASAGAEATADMFPRRGRSAYLGERAIGIPDPGARAVALWLGALHQVIR